MLKVSDAPVGFVSCLVSFDWPSSPVPVGKEYYRYLAFNTDIGDLKTKRCRLVYKTQAK